MGLSNNYLYGSIPTLNYLPELRELYLSHNNLTGWLPSEICSKLPNIKTLYLWDNQLRGQIPANIGKCRYLEDLALSVNHFSGSIPSEIGSLSMLRVLYLGVNDFRGGNLPEIGNLSRLEILSIPGASLIGNIPSSIFNISTLKSMDLSNNSLCGSIPINSFHSLSELEQLYLNNNYLTGRIPDQVGNLTSLEKLSFASNDLSGVIPSTFGNLSLMNYLVLHSNKLIGEIPSSICNLKSLQYLHLSNNSLEGPIPQCFGNLSKSLQFLHLKGNHFNGLIPTTFTKDCSLLSLNLNSNKLEGALPRSLVNCESLQVLDIGNNRLQDTFPFWIETLSELSVLVLRSNMFIGTVLLASKTNLPFLKLQVFDISHNAFTGSVPSRYLKNFRAMIDVNEYGTMETYGASPYQESLTLTLKGLEQTLGRILTIFTTIDLSSNRFFGSIPHSMGNLNSLVYLNLSHNCLTGHIPASLGNMDALESLDLSSNQLMGEIPMQLTRLTFLSVLNLSMNNFSGQIPQSRGQFPTFDNSSYMGNSGLCGFPLTQKCEEDNERSSPPFLPQEGNHGVSRSKRLVHLLKYIVPSFISATILLIIILMLIRRRKNKRTPLSTDISLDIEWRRISYIELERGTSSFSETNLLGKGSFGTVFKGTLSDGLNIAVKVFNLQSEGAAKSFDIEIEILSTIRHRNLVRIIGCCSNTVFKALILAYMPNGSLEKWLYSDTYFLDLVQRLNIAIDVALALEYLHHGHTFPVVHCDIKPSNVLLDEDMTAHVGDFGIAKLFDRGEAMIQTKTLATIGYAAPEYGMEGKVSTNGDVYSYGVMLLEMFTRKKPTDDMFNEEMSLKEWVSEALQKNAIIEVLAPGLLSTEDEHFSAKQQCVLSIFKLAMKCLMVSPEERINMIEAGAVLHKIKARVVADASKLCKFDF